MGPKTIALDELFARWVESYPAKARNGFHADGIISEDAFMQEHPRVLFVMAEPNSTDGAFDRFRGQDLRKVYGEEQLSKALTRNVGLWTRVLLDGVTDYCALNGVQAQAELQRIAVMNLKKFSGSGSADYAGIGMHAWQDRDFIREQVEIIAPELIVTCGDRIHKLFDCVMHNDPFRDDGAEWKWKDVLVVNVQHPSTRGSNTMPAFLRIIEVGRQWQALTKH